MILFLAIFLISSIAFPQSKADKVWNLQLELKPTASQHRQISSYIYGFGTYFHEDRNQEGIWELQPSIYRWGGNTSSRFNYQTNSWNTGNDWFFRNIESNVPNVVDHFMAQNQKHQVSSVITLPLLGWLAKDGKSFSFPRQRFPKQQAFDGDAGNGVALDGKAIKTDPKLSSIQIGPEFIAQWVKKLKTQFAHHPHIYILGNEPMLWHQTHRDVRYYQPVSYDEYLNKYLALAKAVRQADPEAIIVGPALWGWLAWQRSGYDIEGPWNNWKALQDRKKHGNKPFLEWFLQEVVKEEKKFGSSLIDWVDVHYYPESDKWPKGKDHDPKVRRQLLQATRSLWDRDYRDLSWINEKLYFIPRLKELASSIKPSLKVSLGEYNFRSEYDISGAIAQAEILGIFAQFELDAAFYWDFPRKDSTHRYAFQVFRNYDGKGSTFGDRWVTNNIGIHEDLSVYASRFQDKKRITIVSINKSLERNQEIELATSKIGKAKRVRHFHFYSPKLDGQILKSEKLLKAAQNKLHWELTPLSMSLTEIDY